MIQNYFARAALTAMAAYTLLVTSGCSTTTPTQNAGATQISNSGENTIFADIDNDGLKDRIFSATSMWSTVGTFVKRNLGNGKFGKVEEISNIGYKKIRAVKYNEDDNFVDLVGSNNGLFDIEGTFVMYNQGDGTFGPKPPATLASSNLESTVASATSTTLPSLSATTFGPDVVGLAFGDLYGNGRKDRVTSLKGRGTFAEKQLADGTYAPGQLVTKEVYGAMFIGQAGGEGNHKDVFGYLGDEKGHVDKDSEKWVATNIRIVPTKGFDRKGKLAFEKPMTIPQSRGDPIGQEILKQFALARK